MRGNLKLTSNLDDFDDVYQTIFDMHKDLSEEESNSANAKLILTLANHIGDAKVIKQAVEVARNNTLTWRAE